MKSKKRFFNILFFLLIVFFAGTFYLSNAVLKPLIISNVKVCAENEFLNLTAIQLEEIIKSENITYADLAYFEKNNNGEITAVSCNTVKLTYIKTQLTNRINSIVENKPHFKFSIPLGTLVNSNYFGGRGPSLNFKYTLSCTVNSSFKSEFTSTGINQTLHKIILNLSSDVATSMPFVVSSIIVESSYVLAETVIVGNIPQSYFNINS